MVPKLPKNPRHRVGTRKTAEALERVIPPVWHVAKEEAVVIKPRSKPEPGVSVIRAEPNQRADKELKVSPALRGSAMVARPTRPQIFAVN